jgi:hypothetical protein
MGGEPVGIKLPYSQPRVHTAAEVKRLAALLEAGIAESFSRNYSRSRT